MIEGGHVDVVCFEALAELTLAILRSDMLKDPARGFTWDIPNHRRKDSAAAFQRHIPADYQWWRPQPNGAAEFVAAPKPNIGLARPEDCHRHRR